MQEFMEKHAGYDIQGQLAEVRHRIAKELYNIKRIVDDGNFHTVLNVGSGNELTLTYDIPVCCKVSLEGQLPPLHIKIMGVSKLDALSAFAAYKTNEPTREKHDLAWRRLVNQQVLTIRG